MTQVFNKKFQVATCQHCGKVTDISLSSDVRKMVVQNKTLRDQLTVQSRSFKIMLLEKNGQIQALHRTIGKIWLLLNEDQKEKVYKINKELRGILKKH